MRDVDLAKLKKSDEVSRLDMTSDPLLDGRTCNGRFDSDPRQIFLAQLTHVLPESAVTPILHIWALHRLYFMYSKTCHCLLC